MKKGIFFKITLSLAVLITLLLVGVFIAIQSINIDQIKEVLATQVQKNTGRNLSINGSVELKIGLTPKIVVNDVVLSNPAGSTRPEMVTIKRFEMEVAIAPLLSKQVLVNKLILTSPNVLIETEANGPGNLDFSVPENTKISEPEAEEPKETAANTSPSTFSLAFNELNINQGILTIYDRSSKTTEKIDIDLLRITPSADKPSLLNLQLVTRLRGQKIDLSGNVGNIDTLLQQKPWPLALKAAVAGVKLKVDGSVDNLQALQGVKIQLDGAISELTDIFPLLGEQAPSLPGPIGPLHITAQLLGSGKQFRLNSLNLELGNKELATVKIIGSLTDLLGMPTPDLKLSVAVPDPSKLTQFTGSAVPIQGPVSLQSQIQGGGNNWKMSSMELTTKNSDLEGSIALKLGKRPHISATLVSKTMTVADFTASEPIGTTKEQQPTAKTAPKDGRLFSDQPLPLEGLKRMNAKVQIKVAKLVAGNQNLSNAQLTLSLQNGLLALAPFSTGIAGGVLNGTVTLDSGPATPTLDIKLKGNNLNLGSLQSGDAIMGGKTNLNIQLKGAGASVRALMGSLTGESVLSVGEAKLANTSMEWLAGDFIFQILGSINPFANSDKYTQLSCAVVRFVLNDGLATTDKGIAMRTDKVDVIGSGTINLKNEQLNLGIKPHARGGVGVSLSSPLAGLVKVKGTLAQPSMGLDAAGTMKTAVSLGAGVATGGLSTLGELLVDKVVADSDPCQTALGKTSTASKTTTATSQEQKDSTAKPASIEKQLLHNVFGN